MQLMHIIQCIAMHLFQCMESFFFLFESLIADSADMRCLPINLFSSQGSLILDLADPNVSPAADEIRYNDISPQPIPIEFLVQDDLRSVVSKYHAVVSVSRYVFVKERSKYKKNLTLNSNYRMEAFHHISEYFGGATKAFLAL